MTREDRSTMTARLTELVSGIGASVARIARLQSGIATELVILGTLIDEGAAIETVLGRDWKEWAKRTAMDKHGLSDVSTDKLYRVRNAGAVARVIGAEVVETEDSATVTVGGVEGPSYLALIPLYRYLAAAQSAASRKKNGAERDALITAAEEKVRALWAQAVKSAERKNRKPSGDSVLALVEKDQGKGGTRGSAGKSDETPAETPAETPSDAPTGTDEDPGKNTPTAGDSPTVLVVEIDEGAVESATGIVATFLADWQKKYGVSDLAAQAMLAGAIRLVGEHGVPVLNRVLGLDK